jgi:hypothetical protein
MRPTPSQWRHVISPSWRPKGDKLAVTTTPHALPLSPDISKITDYLFVSVWPEARHADEIVQLGIELVLSMHWLPPRRWLRRLPLTVLWLPTIDTRLTPMPLSKLRRGVEAALPVIQRGGSVLCHCKSGVHRSVVMASCVLIGMGYSAEDAMATVKLGRAVADPDVAYIRRRIVEFELTWRSP